MGTLTVERTNALGSGSDFAITFTDSVEGVLFENQMGLRASDDDSNWSFPKSGITPVAVVGSAWSANDVAISVTRTTLSSSAVLVHCRELSTGFLEPAPTGMESVYIKAGGAYESISADGRCKLICGSNASGYYAEFYVDEVLEMKVSAGSLSASTNRKTNNFPVDMESADVLVNAICYGIAGRRVCCTNSISTTQFYSRTYEWVSTVGQTAQWIAKWVKGD